MSDRQITYAYYPESVAKDEPGPALGYKEIFWHIGRARGLSDGQIRKEWAKQGGT